MPRGASRAAERRLHATNRVRSAIDCSLQRWARRRADHYRCFNGLRAALHGAVSWHRHTDDSLATAYLFSFYRSLRRSADMAGSAERRFSGDRDLADD